MKTRGCRLFALIACAVIFSDVPARCEDYVLQIDAARTAMTEMGSKLPDAIRSAKGEDIRSLERVFEINNYALVTIESYLKMLKIYTLSGGYGREEILNILNNWLSFIVRYCAKDIEYLEASAGASQDKAVRDIIREERTNIAKLLKAASKGKDENIRIFAK